MGWFRNVGIALFASASMMGSLENASAQSPTILHATLGETGAKTAEITTEDMRRIVDNGSAIIIDSRSQAEFDAGHIPGAKVVNGADQLAVVARLTGGDKDKALALYCNGPFCQASRRLADQLVDAGYSNVRRYQLGIPVWRALGGPIEIELKGAVRIHKQDQTAVFLDGRSEDQFAKGSISRARNLTPGQARSVQGAPMPLDDFNTRIVVFSNGPSESRELANALGKRPWHNVAFVAASFDELSSAVAEK